MSGDDHSLPPLPRKLAERLRSLRRLRPSEALVERVLGGLPERAPPGDGERTPSEQPHEQLRGDDLHERRHRGRGARA
ncbi:hypothetical protein [Sorangium sp. So ce1389]|uniref:hypothetical protein n=1 Tax=Sorangium sp. So ce1389 TaxID=3133336 RepID=UPI003F617CA0